MPNKNNQKITVLGVMVSGGSYAENIESRRRTRYAILSGLAVKDYAPRDREHIGYIDDLKSEDGVSTMSMPEKIPFEWFQSDDIEHSLLLVLWLDDSVFASNDEHPLKMASELVKLMNKENKLEFKFIGPDNSNTLQAMVDELATPSDETSEYYDFKYYNAIATGDWPGMYIPPTCDGRETWGKKNIKTYIESLGLNSLFTRTSLTDYQLADALLEELRLRGFKIENDAFTDNSLVTQQIINNNFYGEFDCQITHLPTASCKNKCKRPFEAIDLSPSLRLSKFELKKYLPSIYPRKNADHIVLISEWDTIYGRRGLPNAMKHQLVKMESYCDAERIKNNQCDWPIDVDWIHSFSYMRGLDGVVPSSEKPSTEKNTKETKADKDKEGNSAEINLERPEGQNQQDYLRRLAGHIDELNQRLKNNSKGEEIKAIGVLGSDAYDKLMILKALRPYFPKALFFTTDLDMRLMHPKEFDVTRNLIVASSFDLHLADKLQQSIPPFRDSYQTANFFATQIVVDDANGKTVTQEDINAMLGKARVFETANNKAIALNYSNGAENDCENLQDCKNAHPFPPLKNLKVNLLVSILTILLWIIPIIYFLSKYLIEGRSFRYFVTATKRSLVTRRWNNWILLLSWCFFVLLWTITIYYIHHEISSVIDNEIKLGEDGEPFFWHEGISVWPSELIRLFAGILGCLFVADTILAVIENNRQLTRDFKLDSSTTGCVADLWKKHCLILSNVWSGVWIIVCSIVFLVIAGFIIKSFGSAFVPYRGEVSHFANDLVLGKFSVPVFIVLLMTVFVITLRSASFIKKLDKLHSIWPETTLRHFSLIPRETPPVTLEDLRNTLKRQKNYHLDEWLDIQFIAAYTKVIGHFIYYPFIILALMIFSRSKVFDNWDMPIGLVIVFLSAAALTLGSAFYLRRVAEHARKCVIKNITGMKMTLSVQPDSSAAACKDMEKQIDIALAQIQEINEGAFQPLTNSPAFQALLIPFGGVGGVMLLENLVLGF
jgi:hypothetical protein